MSIQAMLSSNDTVQKSVYQDLLTLYEENPRDLKEASLNALPESFRQQIFYHIWEQSEKAMDSSFGEIHVFDSLPKLQRAIQKVAGNTFQLLNQNDKDGIAYKVWKQHGAPCTADRNWGENHAAEDVPFLLRTMHDSLGDLTPEIQGVLDEWVGQAEPGEQRAAARRIIIDFLKENGDVLWLRDCGLKSLPLIFNQKPFISRLQRLILDMNKLTSIPEQIGLLKNLKLLRIEENQLASIPEQIGFLQSLEVLYLGRNLITNLPEQIGSLQQLKILHVNRNQLTCIPEQIEQLQNLQELVLSSNHTLQGLPNQLLNLQRNCTILIEQTGLSEQVRNHLFQICNAPGYQGPRILFSMEDVEQNHSDELKSIAALVAELCSISDEPLRTFPALDMLGDEQKASLQSWLSRFSDTADYKRKGDSQKALAKQILAYLQQANDNPQFREIFFNIIADAAQTCGDRISLSILDVGIAFRLCQIKDIKPLSQFLIDTVWPKQMLEEIARKKAETLSFFDEIEVYLGYPIMLRERLGLDIPVQDMLYFRCSALTSKDLDAAAEEVLLAKQDSNALCVFLSERQVWIDVLKFAYPDRCEKIEDENYEELEKAGDDREKLVLAQTNSKIRWEALTAWALAELEQSQTLA